MDESLHDTALGIHTTVSIDNVKKAWTQLHKVSTHLAELINNMSDEELRKYQDYSIDKYGYIMDILLPVERVKR